MERGVWRGEVSEWERREREESRGKEGEEKVEEGARKMGKGQEGRREGDRKEEKKQKRRKGRRKKEIQYSGMAVEYNNENESTTATHFSINETQKVKHARGKKSVEFHLHQVQNSHPN